MRRRLWLSALPLCAGLACAQGGEPDFGACLTCHGAAGKGNPGVGAPNIALLPNWYIRAQLEAFRQGRRGANTDDDAEQDMVAVARRLSDSDIDRAARHFSQLPDVPAAASLTGDPENGARLYNARCADCHGARGEGAAGKYAPPLAGQMDWYLLKQLRAFQAGHRGAAPGDTTGAAMEGPAQALALPGDGEDITAYLQTLTTH